MSLHFEREKKKNSIRVFKKVPYVVVVELFCFHFILWSKGTQHVAFLPSSLSFQKFVKDT